MALDKFVNDLASCAFILGSVITNVGAMREHEPDQAVLVGRDR